MQNLCYLPRVAPSPSTATPPTPHRPWGTSPPLRVCPQVPIRRLSVLSAYSAEDHLACNASLAGSDLDTFAHYVQQLRRRAVMQGPHARGRMLGGGGGRGG